jgi:hypothetical protein
VPAGLFVRPAMTVNAGFRGEGGIADPARKAKREIFSEFLLFSLDSIYTAYILYID